MDKSEERFIKFWSKWKDRKWSFIAVFGGSFGAVLILVFAIKSIYSGTVVNSWGDYFTSKVFLAHLIGLGGIAGGIYGWIMYRYFSKTDKKINEKYNE